MKLTENDCKNITSTKIENCQRLQLNYILKMLYVIFEDRKYQRVKSFYVPLIRSDLLVSFKKNLKSTKLFREGYERVAKSNRYLCKRQQKI